MVAAMRADLYWHIPALHIDHSPSLVGTFYPWSDILPSRAVQALTPGNGRGRMSAFHVNYPPNRVGRDFVVGDLHGHLDLLEDQLCKVDFDGERDRCFSVGDLIDRGHKPVECLLLALRPWFFPVRGNHEQMMLEAVPTQSMDLWFANGGGWFAETSCEAWPELLEIARSLPFALTIEHCSGQTVGICHAESPVADWGDIEQVEDDDSAIQEMIWGRMRIVTGDSSAVAGVSWVISGHTPLHSMSVLGNSVFIDTGAFYSGNLTLLNLDDFLATREELWACAGKGLGAASGLSILRQDAECQPRTNPVRNGLVVPVLCEGTIPRRSRAL